MDSPIKEEVFGIKEHDSINIEGFSKRFGQLALFENINLSLDDIGVCFLFGENGVGKTTFFKCFSNLENFQGTINLYGKKDIFCIFDDNPLYLNITGYENIKILINQPIDKKKLNSITRKYFSNLDIFFKKKVKKLSLGQRKMISLILLEYLKPRYILLDEIFNGLDIFSRKTVIKLLSEMKQDTFILLSGHEKLYIDISDTFLYIENRNILKVEKNFLYQKLSSVMSLEGDENDGKIN